MGGGGGHGGRGRTWPKVTVLIKLFKKNPITTLSQRYQSIPLILYGSPCYLWVFSKAYLPVLKIIINFHLICFFSRHIVALLLFSVYVC